MNMVKPSKIIVLVAEGCPACTDLKGKINDDDRFEVMDVTTNPKARQLAQKLGITGVPTFLYSNKKGQVCTLNEKGTAGKCIRDEHKYDHKHEEKQA
jgi:thioredoxin-related protein